MDKEITNKDLVDAYVKLIETFAEYKHQNNLVGALDIYDSDIRSLIGTNVLFEMLECVYGIDMSEIIKIIDKENG